MLHGMTGGRNLKFGPQPKRKQIAFRVALDDAELLKEKAAAAGVTVQAWMEARLFDRPYEEVIRHGGRPFTKPQDELPISDDERQAS